MHSGKTTTQSDETYSSELATINGNPGFLYQRHKGNASTASSKQMMTATDGLRKGASKVFEEFFMEVKIGDADVKSSFPYNQTNTNEDTAGDPVEKAAHPKFGTVGNNASAEFPLPGCLETLLKKHRLTKAKTNTLAQVKNMIEKDPEVQLLLRTREAQLEVYFTSAVINTAVFPAYKQMIQGGIANFKDNLGKGQLSTLPLEELLSIPVVITYADVKYSFRMTPKAPDTMVPKIGAQSIEVRYREQADGSMYVAYGIGSQQVFAKEEVLGLRLVLVDVAVLLPTLYDRHSDFTCKLNRYTVTGDGGASVKEAEAMKLIITLNATESGVIKHEDDVIKHEKPASYIINQGDLLVSFTLADTSRVKKIGAFNGTLEYATGEEMVAGSATLKRFRKTQKTLKLVMDGYMLDVEPAVQAMPSAITSVSLFSVYASNPYHTAKRSMTPAQMKSSVESRTPGICEMAYPRPAAMNTCTHSPVSDITNDTHLLYWIDMTSVTNHVLSKTSAKLTASSALVKACVLMGSSVSVALDIRQRPSRATGTRTT